MKFLVAVLALAAVVSAQPFDQKPVAILRQSQDISPEGHYSWSFENENGIAASETGEPVPIGEDGRGVVTAQGQYQYYAPDGTPIQVSYVANEHGFQPQGAHLPVGPEIPLHIQRSLEYIAAHPPKEENNEENH